MMWMSEASTGGVVALKPAKHSHQLFSARRTAPEKSEPSLMPIVTEGLLAVAWSYAYVASTGLASAASGRGLHVRVQHLLDAPRAGRGEVLAGDGVRAALGVDGGLHRHLGAGRGAAVRRVHQALEHVRTHAQERAHEDALVGGGRQGLLAREAGREVEGGLVGDAQPLLLRHLLLAFGGGGVTGLLRTGTGGGEDDGGDGETSQHGEGFSRSGGGGLRVGAHFSRPSAFLRSLRRSPFFFNKR